MAPLSSIRRRRPSAPSLLFQTSVRHIGNTGLKHKRDRDPVTLKTPMGARPPMARKNARIRSLSCFYAEWTLSQSSFAVPFTLKLHIARPIRRLLDEDDNGSDRRYSPLERPTPANQFIQSRSLLYGFNDPYCSSIAPPKSHSVFALFLSTTPSLQLLSSLRTSVLSHLPSQFPVRRLSRHQIADPSRRINAVTAVFSLAATNTPQPTLAAADPQRQRPSPHLSRPTPVFPASRPDPPPLLGTHLVTSCDRNHTLCSAGISTSRPPTTYLPPAGYSLVAPVSDAAIAGTSCPALPQLCPYVSQTPLAYTNAL
ncbi:hypothetical protein C8F04DRAFT_1271067 [Mycena alexandri]|uniref:Uncharacterized protein n=1 Tax=Mycena alexandri TaxID=1745969 RepID=A0AAD6WT04_9AGAR|nr:hypothetical protein C8F04DRAFT_1271067 [Mycena alexandri]